MRSDQQIKIDITNSLSAVCRLANHMVKQGYDIQMDGFRIRSRKEDRFLFQDSCDLAVKIEEEWRALEVKCRKDLFTCMADFPRSTVFVDSKSKTFRRRKYPLLGFVQVSRDHEYGFFIHRDTREHWRIRRIRDGRDNVYTNMVICPKEYCNFFKIDKVVL